MTLITKTLVLPLLTVLIIGIAGCQNESNENNQAQKAYAEFWNMLQSLCGSTFYGKSSFPTDPDDAFFGKQLTAEFSKCEDTEIRMPFNVGENRTRTWIFTKTDDGIRLKHKHIHEDGSLDEVTNYGGDAAFAEYKSEPDVGGVMVKVAFPADDFTKELLPAAATNQWEVTLSQKQIDGNVQTQLNYHLDRHSKPRFRASLVKAK